MTKFVLRKGEGVQFDRHGKPMLLFACEYFHGCDPETGLPRRWSFDLWAYDREDAEMRLRAVKTSGEILGQVEPDN